MARLKSQFEFMAGMYVSKELYFNRYVLTIDCYMIDDIIQNQNIALDRISYFVHSIASSSVFIDETNIKQIDKLTAAGIPVLTVPEPGPVDPVVLAIIVTKLNAILEDVCVISEAEILSEIGGSLVHVWDSADEDDFIHEVVNNNDDTRWWASEAPRFGSYPSGVDVCEVELTQPFPLTWDMLELSWVEDADTTSAQPVVDKAGVIIKADFTSNNNSRK